MFYLKNGHVDQGLSDKKMVVLKRRLVLKGREGRTKKVELSEEETTSQILLFLYVQQGLSKIKKEVY